jgi:S1-C subfamily serine protease
MAQAVRRAAERVLPSVVSIDVIGVAEVAAGGNQTSEVSQDAPSCGIVVDAKGFIIASDIIVRRPSASILVVLQDQTRLAAKIVARDYHRGLVMLRVQSDSPLVPIQLPDSVGTPVGSTVVAVGRYGGDRSPMVSSGILSATERLEGTMLQSDARVSPSFYGGPLVDLYGNAIGVVVPAVAEGGAPDDTSWYDSGIAFAVPTPVVNRKLTRLMDGKDIRKGLIGIVPKTKDPYADGTELAAVRNRSPAEKAGIKSGDSVQSVAGKTVRMFQEIKQALGPFDAGEEIELKVKRDGNTRSVSVTLAESIPPLQPQRLGVWLGEETDDSGTVEGAEEPGGEDQVSDRSRVTVRAVVPGTAADGKLLPGDVINRINETEVTDLATISRSMITAVPDDELAISVQRGDETVEVKMTPTPIAGPMLEETIDQWSDRPLENKWDVQKLRLPDVPNLAAYVAPDPEQVTDDEGIALLVLLLPPENRDPEDALKSWREVAGRYGVVVCAVCSEDEKRWQQKEIDVVSRMATLLSQRVPISVTALAATGTVKDVEASAADSMVIAIALSDRKNFAGVALSEEAKPPAVRLRENEPDRALEILVPIDSISDGPTWLTPIAAAGYPVSLGGEITPADLLRWARLLQTI